MYGLENQTDVDNDMPFRVIGYDGAAYKSDFKFVADYFVQMRKNKNYIAPREVVKHVDEVLKLMQALTKDTEWGDSIKMERKGEPYMDHYFSDRIAEARKEATIKAKIEAYLDCGLSVLEIAGKLNITEEEVSSAIEELEVENLQKQN